MGHKHAKWLICTFIIYNAAQLISCKKDFLEVPPTTNPARQAYINNLASCQEYLIGIYTELSVDLCGSTAVIYPDLIADNIKPVTGVKVLNAQYQWAQISFNMASNGGAGSAGNMDQVWTAGYKLIRSCNYLLENVDRFRNENPGKADDIKGQSLALRAYVYYELVNIFAQPYKFTADASHPGVPYVTTSDYAQPASRQSVAEVYANMISDLDNAIKLLPGSGVNNLFIGRTAAKAILARINLFKGDFAAAKNLAREVMDIVPIMTANYPEDLFKPNDSESLFRLPPAVQETASYQTRFASFLFRSNIQFLSTDDMAETLLERPKDKRRKWVTVSAGNWNITKFPEGVVPNITSPANAYYHTVVRSSEMCLTAAESYARTGNEDSARYYLDAIRKRADASSPSSTAMGAALLDSIYKERRKELCFERLRMFDLLRIGRGVDRKDVSDQGAKHLPYPSPKAIAPISGSDVEYYKLQQNPGY